MHKSNTRKVAEKASDAPAGISSLLLDVESKLTALHTMATALSELLELNMKSPLAKVQRQMSAGFQVAWAVEEMAQDALELVHDAQMIAYEAQSNGGAA